MSVAQDCQIISGNLDVFIPKDFSLKDVANNFDKLLAVSGDVVFFDTGVDDLGSAAFPNLFAIGGSLSLSHNPRVQALSGFRSLFSAGAIKVRYCTPPSTWSPAPPSVTTMTTTACLCPPNRQTAAHA